MTDRTFMPTDERVHLIIEGATASGTTACGIPVGLSAGPTRTGTHDPAETDCHDCTAALQRAASTFERQRAGAGRNDVTRADLIAVTADAAPGGDLDPFGGLRAEPVPRPEPITPRGWDKVEGGGDVADSLARLDPALAGTLRRALAGELVDVTQEVVTWAIDQKRRWWQCRYCGRGSVMGSYDEVTSGEEHADLRDHEDYCEDYSEHAGPDHA